MFGRTDLMLFWWACVDQQLRRERANEANHVESFADGKLDYHYQSANSGTERGENVSEEM